MEKEQKMSLKGKSVCLFVGGLILGGLCMQIKTVWNVDKKENVVQTQNKSISSGLKVEGVDIANLEKRFENNNMVLKSIYEIDGLSGFKMALADEKQTGRVMKFLISDDGNWLMTDVMDLRSNKLLSETVLTNTFPEEVDVVKKYVENGVDKDVIFKYTKGNGERKLLLITDPYCPYCKRLETESISKMDNIEITYLFYPLNQSSEEKIHQFWNIDEKKRGEAYHKFMTEGIEPQVSEIKVKFDIEKAQKIADELKFTGTPHMMNLRSGQIASGNIGLAHMENFASFKDPVWKSEIQSTNGNGTRKIYPKD